MWNSGSPTSVSTGGIYKNMRCRHIYSFICIHLFPGCLNQSGLGRVGSENLQF